MTGVRSGKRKHCQGAVTAQRLHTTTFRYYNDQGELPVFDASGGAAAVFTAFHVWWGNLSTPGNGGWVDYAPPVNDGYQAVDTVLFGAPVGGAAGTVLAGSPYEDTLYFIDVFGNNDLDNNDFVWLDGGSVAGAYDDGDTVLSTLQPGAFSVKASLTPDSLWVLLHANGGTVENVSIDRITDTAGNPTGVALRQMRVYLKYTPALENHSNVDKNATYADRDLANTGGVPAGVETIEIKPYADAAYDELGNVASEGNTSGELLLYKSNRPRLKKAVLAYDNCSVMLQFNKRIYGNNQGILGNYLAVPMMAE